MTIEECITLVDEMQPNLIDRARKIEWLSRVDSRIFEELMCKHQGGANIPQQFTGYTQETDPDTELFAKYPYDEMYRFYLEMQIDYANQEYDKYNNNAQLFNELWGEYARKYHRDHKPLSGAHWRF